MKTRSQNFPQTFKQKFTVGEMEAAKALVELKNATTPRRARTVTANTYPSGRPRRSTATPVNYSE